MHSATGAQRQWQSTRDPSQNDSRTTPAKYDYSLAWEIAAPRTGDLITSDHRAARAALVDRATLVCLADRPPPPAHAPGVGRIDDTPKTHMDEREHGGDASDTHIKERPPGKIHQTSQPTGRRVDPVQRRMGCDVPSDGGHPTNHRRKTRIILVGLIAPFARFPRQQTLLRIGYGGKSVADRAVGDRVETR
jgi:hypothetical protein